MGSPVAVEVSAVDSAELVGDAVVTTLEVAAGFSTDARIATLTPGLEKV